MTMPTITLSRQDTAATTIAILEYLLGPQERWAVGVRLWDGTHAGPAGSAATIVLREPWTLRSMFSSHSDLKIAEAFIYGDVDVEGDLEAALRAFLPAAEEQWDDPRRMAHIARLMLTLPAPPHRHDARRATPSGRRHSMGRDKETVRHHYDVSNDFYKLWLDPRMQYSCAYFEQPDASLEDAQSAKVEHICRKLRLSAGDELLDIGCGWGGLLEHATRERGVRGLGVTLSQPQVDEANRRLAEAGLGHLTRAEVRDYREVEGHFDAIASVGMVEHVGIANLRRYFDQAMSLLRPGGAFLVQSITTRGSDRPGHGSEFIERYVFPDGELPTVADLTKTAEYAGFEVRDVEGLREHYAATLRHWVHNLVRHRDEAIALTDEVTFRIWWLYMTGCVLSFERGLIGVYQFLLVKPTGASGPPTTRADWYERAAAST